MGSQIAIYVIRNCFTKNYFYKYSTTFVLYVLKVQRSLVRSSPWCIENKQKDSQKEE